MVARYDTPVFGLVVMSAVALKAKVDLSLACFPAHKLSIGATHTDLITSRFGETS